MVYLSSDELSSLLIAKKLLQDISGGTIGKDIVSITQKISNILNRHVSSEGTSINPFFPDDRVLSSSGTSL